MNEPMYVSYVASLSATVTVPLEQVIEQTKTIDSSYLRDAFEQRMEVLDGDGDLEWAGAVELTDPTLEDRFGNPIVHKEPQA